MTPGLVTDLQIEDSRVLLEFAADVIAKGLAKAYIWADGREDEIREDLREQFLLIPERRHPIRPV